MSKDQARDRFRKAVYRRDDSKCVVPWCNEDAVDAHHIIERALWTEDNEKGGYLIENGASVCEAHHRACEADWIPPQALRIWAGISDIRIPAQFDADITYTKWGKPVKRPNRKHIKYPHTPYLEFSPSADEKDISDSGYFTLSDFVGKPLVVTVKLDGSNMLMTSEKIAARNGYDAPHASFDMAKAMHPTLAPRIPPHIQIFGEWLYARHSIHYVDDLALNSLFYVFAVYDQKNELWLSWHEVKEYARLIGAPTVPAVGELTADNVYHLQSQLEALGSDTVAQGHEGIVVRSIYPYVWGHFAHNVAKYVRANHVATDTHWSHQPIVRNELS